MNPILIFIMLISGCLLWLICSFLYRPIGKLFGSLWDDAKETINREEIINDKIDKKEKE